jgi:NAD(P)-dependent dehydrogenase (short-subunit alcohol dehydrogenase family)
MGGRVRSAWCNVCRDALRFAAKVVLGDQSLERVAATARTIGADAIGVRFDITDPTDCDEIVLTAMRHGRLDIVACATVTGPPWSLLEDLSPAEWDRVMAVNAKGPFLLARSAVPKMTPGGRLVFVHSAHAQLGAPRRAVYSASKGALGSLIKSLALELAPRAITVNGVAPLHIDGPVNEASLRVLADAEGTTIEAMRDKRDKSIPLGRPATLTEVADTMLFLSSPEAAYITGTILDINGGVSLR